jgi:chromosomal replication initiator protein
MIEPVLPGISIRLIQRICADHFKIEHEAMLSPERRREIARPRQFAMALACEFLPEKSPGTIAYYFGGRDRTTLFHAQHAIAELADRDPAARADLAALRAAIEAHRPAEIQLELALAA